MGRKASPNKNDFSTQLAEQVKNIALLKKEIQIEAALEKVRARTMAMQKTEELPQIINILFQQLQELSFDIYACSLALINERMSQEMWIAGYSKDILPQSYEIQYIDHIYFTHFIDIWQKGISYDVLSFEGKKKKEYDKYLFYETGMSTLPEEAKAEIMKIEKTFICAAYMKYGWIEINAEEGLPADQANILQRFAKVFEQTYTRFLDLQKAEAQTREAEIQLALERVRARTMAMHRSEELGEVAILLYKEFNALKMGDFFNCGFVIVNEADSVQNGWMTQPEGDFIEELDLPYPGDSIFKERLNAWSEGTGVFCQKVAGEKLAEHIKYVSDRSISKNQLSTILPYMPDPCYFYCGNFKEGYLHIVAKEELVPEAEAILARFTKVFSQTYTRFLDLQKAEAQAREARIETALEKIRSNMMAMHQSDELRQVVATMYDQLQNLGFDSSASMINIYNDDLSAEQWMAGFSHGELPKSYHIPYCDHPYFTEEVSGWQDGLPFHELIFEGPQKVEYAKWMIEHSDYKFLPAEFHQEMLSPERIYISNAHMKYGLVGVWGTEPLPEKSIATLIRFAKVFEQTYTRFLDLQKAEEQARESQIEASMERVRARAMAMHTTGELNELVALIYDEIQKLGLFDYGCSIIICDEANKVLQFWYAEINQLQSFRCYNVPINSQPVVQEQYQSWKKGLTQFDIEIRGKEHKEYIEFLLTETDHKKLPEEVKEGWRSFSEVFFTYSNFKYGLLEFVDVKPIDKNNYPIYQRFAKVFEQTYTRFLDLQKAEAQAREAQIEAGLERVRSASLAMHQTSELGDVVKILFEQFFGLGLDFYQVWINIFKLDEGISNCWFSPVEGVFDEPYTAVIPLNPFEDSSIKSWRAGEEFSYLSWQGRKEVDQIATELSKITGHPSFKQIQQKKKMDRMEILDCNHKYGVLAMAKNEDFTEEDHKILKRFTKAFEQAFTRFLDLQKAEEQAREAQIEAALERVRSRSMAMHHSQEMAEVAQLLFQQMKLLGIDPWACGLHIMDADSPTGLCYMSSPGGKYLSEPYAWKYEDEVTSALYASWKKEESMLVIDLKGQDLLNHTEYLARETEAPTEAFIEEEKSLGYSYDRLVLNYGNFKHGSLVISTRDRLEDPQLVTRFAKVFEQTYTRFLDLKKAEAQAREAQIEAALEKVRSAMMAMHQSDLLRQVVAMIFEQFQTLGFDSSATMLSVYNEDLSSEQWMVGFSHDELPKSYHVPFCEHPYFTEEVAAWQKGTPFHELIFEGLQKVEYATWMIKKSDYQYLPTEFHQEMLSPERIYISNAYTKYGLVELMGSEPLSQDSKSTLIRFAKVFEQTYTRFLDLQKAEAQAREAKIQLALERVRARAMAMHQSQELAEVVALMYGQIQSLGFTDWGCAIIICDEEAQIMYYWYADINMSHLPDYFKVPLTNKTINKTWELWKQGTPQFIIELHDEKMAEYADFMLEETDHKNLPQEVKDGWRSEKNVYFSYSNIKYGLLEFTEVVPFKEENLIIYQRFAHVLEQTYTRFLDLQKAEKQAKEAQIETALEKVRSRTMAMQKSEELLDLVKKIYSEIEPFGVSTTGITIALFREEENAIENWYADNLHSGLLQSYKVVGQKNMVFKQIWEDWKNKNPQRKVYLEGPDKRGYDNYILTETDYRQLPEELKEEIHSHKTVCFTFTYFKYGYFESIDLTIPAEENAKILLRFAKVFEQTYTRFLDLQKAEAQAKEAETELALERIRARTMAMHHSDELIEVVKTLNKQFLELRPETVANWLGIVNVESNSMKIIGSVMNGLLQEFIANGSELPSYQNDLDEFKKGIPHWQFSLPKEEILRIWRESFVIDEAELPEAVTEYYLLHTRHAFGFFGFGSWEKADEETIVILSRFAKVFEQTYTRFLDLQKAEAQAREAGIELALERVRAKTMAMQKSNEFIHVATVMNQEFEKLGFTDALQASFILIDEEKEVQYLWGAQTDSQLVEYLTLPLLGDDVLQERYDAWKRKEPVLSVTLTGEKRIRHLEVAMPLENINGKQKQGRAVIPDPFIFCCGFFKYGYLFIISTEVLDEGQQKILVRMAKVFEQTYTRFLDLQKAEAQAREAEIELALERVRAKTMAMQKSDELSDVAALLFKQIKILGAELWTISIAFCKEDELIVEKWGGSPITDQIFAPNFIPYNADHGEQSMYDTWKNKVELYSYVQEGKELKDIYDHLMTIPGFKANFQKVIDAGRPLPVWQKNHVASFKYGYLLVITEEEFKEEYVFTRFAKVFEQTYTRFLDLQKAEAQTREAQIEASMERIRSRSLAMRTSDEIKDVMVEIRRQIDSLGQLDLEASVVHLYEKGNPMFESIAAVRPPGESGNIVLANVFFPVDGTDRIKDMMDYYWSDTKEYTLEFDKKMAEEWQQVMLTYAPMIAERRVGFVENRRISDYAEYWNFADFSEGSLLLVTHSPASEDTKTVLRKASQVFDLAYRRYRDLQKAEARAKEAIRQASLDRVRGEIASMRSTEDLNRITPLIWNELTALGVSFIRCGVFIIDEKSEIVDIYLSSPDGKSLGVMKLPFNSNDLTANTVKAWKKDCVYHQFWSRDAFISWTNSLVSQGFISDKEKYQGNQEAPAALNLNFIPFTQGMLYVGTAEELPNSKVELVKSLAKAFALAYSRYEDFVKLEMAKSEIESTLSELKATQAQLIQSEKMASLGELTAGIAHEIQNPLNFVNNFSEVSSEMIDEMKEELAKGDIKEAEAISDDLKENLEKIHHHGNRASSIVKGMLEHSRTSSGKKELTDINALADEYLRLTYHGLRAKEKDFNAEMVTHFDPKLPKIEVIPQDIGRVFLNLINNAFQAVQEEGVRKKEHGDLNYQPKVSITTQLITNNQLQITITDNGPGIPDEIKDKIFQPFFTTKDTGQGTGLGLSLAYDIVKAHGGELTVESHENEGTDFTIKLSLS